MLTHKMMNNSAAATEEKKKASKQFWEARKKYTEYSTRKPPSRTKKYRDEVSKKRGLDQISSVEDYEYQWPDTRKPFEFFTLYYQYDIHPNVGTVIDIFGVSKEDSELGLEGQPVMVRLGGFNPHCWIGLPTLWVNKSTDSAIKVPKPNPFWLKNDGEMVHKLMEAVEVMLQKSLIAEKEEMAKGIQENTLINMQPMQKMNIRNTMMSMIPAGERYKYRDNWNFLVTCPQIRCVSRYEIVYEQEFMWYNGNERMPFIDIYVIHPCLIPIIRRLFERPYGRIDNYNPKSGREAFKNTASPPWIQYVLQGAPEMREHIDSGSTEMETEPEIPKEDTLTKKTKKKVDPKQQNIVGYLKGNEIKNDSVTTKDDIKNNFPRYFKVFEADVDFTLRYICDTNQIPCDWLSINANSYVVEGRNGFIAKSKDELDTERHYKNMEYAEKKRRLEASGIHMRIIRDSGMTVDQYISVHGFPSSYNEEEEKEKDAARAWKRAASNCVCEILVPDYREVKMATNNDNIPEFRIMSFDGEMKTNGKNFPKAKGDKKRHEEGDPIIQWGICMGKLDDSDIYENEQIYVFCNGQTDDFDKDSTYKKDGGQVFSFGTEREMLIHFIAFISAMDPDFVIHYNGNGFDFPYLLDRMSELGLESLSPYIGRSTSRPVRCTSREVKGKPQYEVEVIGRINMDILKLIHEKKFENESLGYVSSKILDNRTKADFDVRLIEKFWNQGPSGRNIIRDYVCIDAQLPLHILKKENYINILISTSRISRAPLQKCLNQAQELKVVSRLRQNVHHLVHPTDGRPLKLLKDCKRDGVNKVVHGDEKYEGAIVLEPKPGFYEYVATLDFAGLYPSIMMLHNLCYTTVLDNEIIARYGLVEDIDYALVPIIDKEKTLETQETTREIHFLPKSQWVPFMKTESSEGGSARGRNGQLPELLKLLKKERSAVKRVMNEYYRKFKHVRDLKDLIKKEMKDTISDPLVLGMTKPSSIREKIENEYNKSFDEVMRETAQIFREVPRIAPLLQRDPHLTYATLNQASKALFSLYKKEDANQDSLKRWSNSGYGITGNKLSSYFLEVIASTVTAYGRYMIMRTKFEVEKKYNYYRNSVMLYPFGAKVVYGDTDSVFVWMDEFNGTPEEACEWGDDMAKYINDTFFKDPVKLEFEKVCVTFSLIKRKNYFGSIINKSDMLPNLLTKGFRHKKRGSCAFMKNVCKTVTVFLANDPKNGLAKAVEFVKTEFRRLMDRKVHLGELIKSQTLSKEIDDYKSVTPGVTIARKLEKKTGAKIRAGYIATWIHIEKSYLDRKRPKCEKIVTIEDVLEHGYDIDVKEYIADCMQTLCRIMGPQAKDITKKCPTVWNLIFGKSVSRIEHLQLPTHIRLNQEGQIKKNTLTRFVTTTPNCIKCGKASKNSKFGHRHIDLSNTQTVEQLDKFVVQQCTDKFAELRAFLKSFKDLSQDKIERFISHLQVEGRFDRFFDEESLYNFFANHMDSEDFADIHKIANELKTFLKDLRYQHSRPMPHLTNQVPGTNVRYQFDSTICDDCLEKQSAEVIKAEFTEKTKKEFLENKRIWTTCYKCFAQIHADPVDCSNITCNYYNERLFALSNLTKSAISLSNVDYTW